MLRDYLAATRCRYWSSSGSASETFNRTYSGSARSIYSPSKYRAILSWLRQTKGSWSLSVRLGPCALTSPEAASSHGWAGRVVQQGQNQLVHCRSSPRTLQSCICCQLHWQLWLMHSQCLQMSPAQHWRAQQRSHFFFFLFLISCRILHPPLSFLLLTSWATNSLVSKASYRSL